VSVPARKGQRAFRRDLASTGRQSLKKYRPAAVQDRTTPPHSRGPRVFV
jgi:hypothetical protein